MEKRMADSALAKSKCKDPIDIGDRVHLHSMEGEDSPMNGKSGKVVDEYPGDDGTIELVVRLPLPRGFEEKVIKRSNLMHTDLYLQEHIRRRAAFFANKREQIHEDALEAEYARCDKMKEIMLHDQAVEERVHQHKSLRKLAFAREWTRRRVRWQLKNNSVVSNRNERSAAILKKHQAAAERVEAQQLIRQKCVEYKREIRSLSRLHADLAAKREAARQDARRDAVASELSRLSYEEADPSPSPMRRNKALTMSLGATTGRDITNAPFSPLLNQTRVTKRMARFDFPRMGSGMMSSSFMSASTGSGTWSMRQSTSMPSIGSSSGGDQRALTSY
jgi:hypothetical protein